MFIYNLKINKNLLTKISFLIMLIIIVSILSFSIYLIFFQNNRKVKLPDTIESSDIFEVNEANYTNILKAANDNIDSYIGCKVHITGYVYRLLDFNENQFVIARDMKLNDATQSLVVGFLCNYNKASDFADGTWIDIIGEITKGDFNGEIAILNIISIKETDQPETLFVNPPDNTYIPTTNMF